MHYLSFSENLQTLLNNSDQQVVGIILTLVIQYDTSSKHGYLNLTMHYKKIKLSLFINRNTFTYDQTGYQTFD